MRKTFLQFSIAGAAAVLMFLGVTKAGNSNIAARVHSISFNKSTTVDSSTKDDSTDIENADNSNHNLASVSASALLYEGLKLKSLGLSKEVLEYAYNGYKNLVEKGKVPKDNILTICDFSQSSRKKRMYIIDMENNKLLVNTFVAHGKNSGIDYATKFSNVAESLESSLGFYVTEGTYEGKHGISLRINGLEAGFNDNAEARGIVVHGAEYVSNGRAAGSTYMGRSFGCPAVPQDEVNKVINIIKGGTCLFIYHPTASYLHGSKILNG